MADTHFAPSNIKALQLKKLEIIKDLFKDTTYDDLNSAFCAACQGCTARYNHCS